jgi:hypothetical protein
MPERLGRGRRVPGVGTRVPGLHRWCRPGITGDTASTPRPATKLELMRVSALALLLRSACCAFREADDARHFRRAAMSEAMDVLIAQRVERLERAQRRWQRLAAGAVLGLVAVAVMGQKPAPRVVEAERFILRDGAGRIRAELGVDGEQSVALRFRDADNLPRLSVGTENGASVLVLNEQGGKVRAGLVTLPQGSPALTLYDSNGKNRAELGLTREGAPALTITDRDGFLAWKTPNN